MTPGRLANKLQLNCATGAAIRAHETCIRESQEHTVASVLLQQVTTC